jgi:hypothetical protein
VSESYCRSKVEWHAPSSLVSCVYGLDLTCEVYDNLHAGREAVKEHTDEVMKRDGSHRNEPPTAHNAKQPGAGMFLVLVVVSTIPDSAQIMSAVSACGWLLAFKWRCHGCHATAAAGNETR